uniref:Uncharacterized protein n=1 Tax=Anguilla anguilla TaxID=7936 RepID=A0A0E9V3I3_ANGAN
MYGHIRFKTYLCYMTKTSYKPFGEGWMVSM